MCPLWILMTIADWSAPWSWPKKKIPVLRSKTRRAWRLRRPQGERMVRLAEGGGRTILEHEVRSSQLENMIFQDFVPVLTADSHSDFIQGALKGQDSTGMTLAEARANHIFQTRQFSVEGASTPGPLFILTTTAPGTRPDALACLLTGHPPSEVLLWENDGFSIFLDRV